jgi:hypothetical protein
MLERVHGQPYGRVIEDVIARPLSLASLTYCDKARPIAQPAARLRRQQRQSRTDSAD